MQVTDEQWHWADIFTSIYLYLLSSPRDKLAVSSSINVLISFAVNVVYQCFKVIRAHTLEAKSLRQQQHQIGHNNFLV